MACDCADRRNGETESDKARMAAFCKMKGEGGACLERLLLVASNENGMKMFGQLLNGRRFDYTAKSASGGEARRLLLENDFDLILINTPLSDEFGEELAEQAAESRGAVIVLVKSELADRVSYKVADNGVMVVEKPTSVSLFDAVLRMAEIASAKLMRLEQENARLQRRLEETKAVSTAKCLLIEREGLSEPQAHRYIEKLAMDSRRPRIQIAREVIQRYGG